MSNTRNTNPSTVLLAAVIIARSTSFMFSKIALQTMSPFNLLALRFLLAFALLALVFHRRLRLLRLATVLRGAALGLVFSGVMVCEMFSLRTTSTAVTSFLENSAVVIVPLLNMALTKTKPRRCVLIGCVPVFAGVAVLTLGGGAVAVGRGVVFSLVAALLYSCAILLTAEFSKKDDPLLLGIVEVGCIGAVCLVAALLTGGFTVAVGAKNFVCIAVLAVVCSGFGFTLQPLAQKNVDTETAGIFCALNPLSCTGLGIIFLREPCTPLLFVGAALVVWGIAIANGRHFAPREVAHCRAAWRHGCRQ